MMFNTDFKIIYTENLKTRHFTNNSLYKAYMSPLMSYTTFRKKLDNPKSFTLEEIDQLCIGLRLTKEEREIIKGETTIDEKIQRICE